MRKLRIAFGPATELSAHGQFLDDLSNLDTSAVRHVIDDTMRLIRLMVGRLECYGAEPVEG